MSYVHACYMVGNFIPYLITLTSRESTNYEIAAIFMSVTIRVLLGCDDVCSVAIGYQSFGRPCCLHLQVAGELSRNIIK